LDRAFVIEFRDVDIEEYRETLGTEVGRINEKEIKELAGRLVQDLRRDINGIPRFTAIFKDDVKRALKEKGGDIEKIYRPS